MKLYYAPHTCSLSPHIVAAEAGLALDLEQVDLGSHRTAMGADYRAVNPLGYVPALRLDDGQLLTEGAAIVQYLADRAPGAGLAPPPGSIERVRLQEWLSFVGTELHKAFSPWLVHPEVGAQAQAYARGRIADRLAFVERRLAAAPYLMARRSRRRTPTASRRGWSAFPASTRALSRLQRYLDASPPAERGVWRSLQAVEAACPCLGLLAPRPGEIGMAWPSAVAGGRDGGRAHRFALALGASCCHLAMQRCHGTASRSGPLRRARWRGGCCSSVKGPSWRLLCLAAILAGSRCDLEREGFELCHPVDSAAAQRRSDSRLRLIHGLSNGSRWPQRVEPLPANPRGPGPGPPARRPRAALLGAVAGRAHDGAGVRPSCTSARGRAGGPMPKAAA